LLAYVHCSSHPSSPPRLCLCVANLHSSQVIIIFQCLFMFVIRLNDIVQEGIIRASFDWWILWLICVAIRVWTWSLPVRISVKKAFCIDANRRPLPHPINSPIVACRADQKLLVETQVYDVLSTHLQPIASLVQGTSQPAYCLCERRGQKSVHVHQTGSSPGASLVEEHT
jgi:hypothetical protein